MLTTIVAQVSANFLDSLAIYAIIAYAVIFIHLYIFRAIFNIPSFLRYQKAQIRLLEELAKNQGVDATKVKSIISETEGWDSPSPSTTSNATA